MDPSDIPIGFTQMEQPLFQRSVKAKKQRRKDLSQRRNLLDLEIVDLKVDISKCRSQFSHKFSSEDNLDESPNDAYDLDRTSIKLLTQDKPVDRAAMSF